MQIYPRSNYKGYMDNLYGYVFATNTDLPCYMTQFILNFLKKFGPP